MTKEDLKNHLVESIKKAFEECSSVVVAYVEQLEVESAKDQTQTQAKTETPTETVLEPKKGLDDPQIIHVKSELPNNDEKDRFIHWAMETIGQNEIAYAAARTLLDEALEVSTLRELAQLLSHDVKRAKKHFELTLCDWLEYKRPPKEFNEINDIVSKCQEEKGK